jgi:hypothetical protein
MANPFYTYSGVFLPGILARAEAESAEFQAVQTGFALLAIQGTDSGAANAYSVVTQGGKNGIYTDGMILEFKATNANTGGSTISVDSGSTVSLTDFQGQTLAGGAIKANTWVRCLYNSTYSAWTLIAPTSQVITSNTISAAAPTNKVGLTAAGGVSLACAPIDVTFAIDQGIVPTWTGAHTFSAAVTFNSTVTFSGGLTLTATAGSYAATLNGANSAGNSFGLDIAAGKNSSDAALLVANQGGGTQFAKIDGAGSVTIGSPTGGGQGVGTINATGLFVNGAAVKTTSVSSANPSATIGLSAVNGVAATFMTSDSAPALSQAIAPTWTGAHTFSYTGGTPVTVNAAANKIGMVLNGGTNTGNQYLMELITGQGSGFSSGLYIQAGTNSSDAALNVSNAAATLNYFLVYGDGECLIHEPSAATNQASPLWQVGYIDIPLKATNTPGAQTERGKFLDATSSVTLPTGGPIGETMLIYNTTSSTITISSSDTITWLPTNVTGTRTLAAHSVATVYRRLSTTWLIWGFGLT